MFLKKENLDKNLFCRREWMSVWRVWFQNDDGWLIRVHYSQMGKKCEDWIGCRTKKIKFDTVTLVLIFFFEIFNRFWLAILMNKICSLAHRFACRETSTNMTLWNKNGRSMQQSGTMWIPAWCRPVSKTETETTGNERKISVIELWVRTYKTGRFKTEDFWSDTFCYLYSTVHTCHKWLISHTARLQNGK